MAIDCAGAWSLQIGPLADGAHRVVATAVDVAGNVAAPTTFDFAVDTSVAPTPTIAPTIAASSVPTPPSTATGGGPTNPARGDLGVPLLLLASMALVLLAVARRGFVRR